MPRRSIFTAVERASLLALPDNQDELIKQYTFTEDDLRIIRAHRRPANRLGFAVQLCYMRFPGVILGVDDEPQQPLLHYVASQLNVPVSWKEYGDRPQTRREHLVELQSIFGFQTFKTAVHYRTAVQSLDELARQTDKGIVLAIALIQFLRGRQILLPTIDVIERICAEAATKATRRIFRTLTATLTETHRRGLDALLKLRDDSKVSVLTWLREPPGAPKARNLLEHIDRLKTIEALDLPERAGRELHQNRLLKIAREGGQMTPQHLAELETVRRHATLVAVMLESKATVIDEIVDLNDRIIGSLFNRAKHRQEQDFQDASKAINEKVRLYGRVGQAILTAKAEGTDPFEAIERVLPWPAFERSVAKAQKLAQGEDFDFLPRLADGYGRIHGYTDAFLNALHFQASSAARDVFDAAETVKVMNELRIRTVPKNAPTAFVRKRWEKVVFTTDGLDRRFYELCAMSELKNSLRSGDIWVVGSRQFKDFDEYLLPANRFAALKQSAESPIAISSNCDQYLKDRLGQLERQLATVNDLAKADKLPDAIVNAAGLKITPLTNAVPDQVEQLMQQAYALMPHVKITELLLEVDQWTHFSRHFTDIRSNEPADNQILLLTAILADGINLGLTKMVESCPGTTYAKLSWLQAWHIRDETYSAALAELVNAQFRQPFAAQWGDGTTSSSDGQRFRAGGRAGFSGNVNPKYGSEPGVLFYTHISDQYAPFHTKVINVGVRDATYVLDGLLHHESDLRIEEHYTDTAGFTDHVFALMHMLGYRFAPRIRDLADKRLFVPGDDQEYAALDSLIGDQINASHIRNHWDELLRLAVSIKEGTVTASLMLRKLGSYPRQNGLAVALRELGRIERTLFTLDWLQDVELRRRVHAGLNKGEAKNALARAVFFNRLGEVRDRSFENQRYRASGLNLVVAAIILWNTVYLDRAISALQSAGRHVDPSLIPHLSPIGWEHINLTGDYARHRCYHRGHG